MSSALKCNRCHKCFDPLDQGMCKMVRFRNPYIRSGEDVRKRKYGKYFLENTDDSEYVDLCPDCSEDWLLFMEGYKLAVHDCDFDRPDQDAQTEENLDECFQKMKREKEETAQGTDEKKDETMPVDRLADVMGRFMTALFGDWEEDEEE